MIKQPGLEPSQYDRFSDPTSWSFLITRFWCNLWPEDVARWLLLDHFPSSEVTFRKSQPSAVVTRAESYLASPATGVGASHWILLEE